jgi:hypothetical protein
MPNLKLVTKKPGQTEVLWELVDMLFVEYAQLEKAKAEVERQHHALVGSAIQQVSQLTDQRDELLGALKLAASGNPTPAELRTIAVLIADVEESRRSFAPVVRQPAPWGRLKTWLANILFSRIFL